MINDDLLDDDLFGLDDLDDFGDDLEDDFGDDLEDDFGDDLEDDFGDINELEPEDDMDLMGAMDEESDEFGFLRRPRYMRQARIYRNRYKRYMRAIEKGKEERSARKERRLERTFKRLKRLWERMKANKRVGMKSPARIRKQVIKLYGKPGDVDSEDVKPSTPVSAPTAPPKVIVSPRVVAQQVYRPSVVRPLLPTQQAEIQQQAAATNFARRFATRSPRQPYLSGPQLRSAMVNFPLPRLRMIAMGRGLGRFAQADAQTIARQILRRRSGPVSGPAAQAVQAVREARPAPPPTRRLPLARLPLARLPLARRLPVRPAFRPNVQAVAPASAAPAPAPAPPPAAVPRVKPTPAATLRRTGAKLGGEPGMEPFPIPGGYVVAKPEMLQASDFTGRVANTLKADPVKMTLATLGLFAAGVLLADPVKSFTGETYARLRRPSHK